MNKNNESNGINYLKQIKIKFKIRYETKSGQNIYILGSSEELGNWKDLKFKLKWTNGHIWEQILTLPSDKVFFHYKFVCYDGNDKSRRWESGNNRYFDRRFLPINETSDYELFCKWEKFDLSFNIYYPIEKPHEYIQIIGNNPSIGNWFKDGGLPVKMSLSDKKVLGNIEGRFWELNLEILNDNKESIFFEYRYSIYNPITGNALWEREPNRNIIIKTTFEQEDIEEYINSSNVKETELLINGIILHQDINFVGGLKFDKIGDFPIYIGPYPQNENDIEILYKEGITAVLNVQTDLDIKHRQINWDLNMKAYEKRNIEVIRYPIEDFNQEDLRQKLYHANVIVKELIEKGKIIYVHCTAGMSRAAASVIGYLVIFCSYKLDQAFDFVKHHRSVIAPNMNVLRFICEKYKPEENTSDEN